MNVFLTIPEIALVTLGLGLLLLDLWTPQAQKRDLGFAAIAATGLILVGTFLWDTSIPQYAFGRMYVLDELAMFFKRFFLLTGMFVLVMSMDYMDRLETGIVEYYVLILFALAGMMWAASVNDFSLLFVSVELITVTFYVLTSFQRQRQSSLEAGIKYLILGAMSSAFLVYGIALIFGSAGTMSFDDAMAGSRLASLHPVYQLGLILVLVALGFKIAVFPLQIWVPDVYQGSPTPTTALLAVGSKAAGFVLLLRVLFCVAPELTQLGRPLLMAICAVTILYGNLCAIPQRNLKRLLGYSSIANAGYMLLGVAAMSVNGTAAILFYLGGYLFAVSAAFTVICLVTRKNGSEDIAALAGLRQRSPFLAATMTIAMASLAGIPSLAGFFGKFLLLKATLEQASKNTGFYCLAGVALIGIVISLYYYFGVIRAIYWTKTSHEPVPIEVSLLCKLSLGGCVAALFYLGVFPNGLLDWAETAAKVLRLN